MKPDMRRRYIRLVFGGSEAKQQLARAISSLKRTCVPWRNAPEIMDRLFLAMSGMVFWPSKEELDELDSAVTRLAFVERSKAMAPRWKAYKLVNDRMAGFRLVNNVDALIARAHRLLQDEQQSNRTKFAELCGPTITGEEHSPLLRSFLADLGKIRRRSTEVAKIDWRKYEQLLSASNKPIRLACGDFPASARVICYSHALEVIVEAFCCTNEASIKSKPLIEWVASLGNPKYAALLRFDPLAESDAKRAREFVIKEKKTRARTKTRERQRRHRKRTFPVNKA
jgi:hypothetical protein